MKNSPLKYIIPTFVFLTVFYRISFAQMQEGKIVFERKINLFKKFEQKSTQDYIGEKNKYMTEEFTLYFNDSMSVFIPEINYQNSRLNWATDRNTVIQNLNQNISRSILNLWGSPILIKDSLLHREWKFTDKWRIICQIECMQAVCEIDDSTRIYAWFTSAITPNVGPESYCNLPGAILGMATEDGSVTYFAKSIEERKIDFEEIMPKFNEKKAKSRKEIIEKARRDYKQEKEIDQYIKRLFLW